MIPKPPEISAPGDWPFAGITSAALVLLVAVVIWVTLAATDTPAPSHLSCADPLVRLVIGTGGIWLAPVLATAVSVGWLSIRRPTWNVAKRAMPALVLALGVVAGGMSLAALTGSRPVPWFVPTEESACPGLLLGYTAGMLEEAVFRGLVLPLSFAALRRRARPLRAAAIAIFLTSLLFAVSHEAGPGLSAFSPAYFATRFLFPGCLMSAMFFWPGPAFPVALHCALHLVIPFWYASPVQSVQVHS